MDRPITDPAGVALGERVEQIASRRAALYRRLDDGFVRIDGAVVDGRDVERWESFWIRLLREYEAICDKLDQAA